MCFPWGPPVAQRDLCARGRLTAVSISAQDQTQQYNDEKSHFSTTARLLPTVSTHTHMLKHFLCPRVHMSTSQICTPIALQWHRMKDSPVKGRETLIYKFITLLSLTVSCTFIGSKMSPEHSWWSGLFKPDLPPLTWETLDTDVIFWLRVVFAAAYLGTSAARPRHAVSPRPTSTADAL